MTDVIVLQFDSVIFYSECDEILFFEWLGKIAATKSVSGRLRTIDVEIDVTLLGEEEVLELIAVFHRYSANMREIRKLDIPKFSKFLRREKMYWYEAVFRDD